jgi:5-formyltetrahydrofolate cyclo-ligase
MSAALCGHLLRSQDYLRSEHVAAYLPIGGEPDLGSLMQAALDDGKSVYLPALVEGPRAHLEFRLWSPAQSLADNRFGIPEPPDIAETCDAEHLDLVLLPLVAFDDRGNRLGMGAGFYDRSFAFRLERPQSTRPRLIGTAWALQQVAEVPTHPRDVPVDAVVTEQGWHGPWQRDPAA